MKKVFITLFCIFILLPALAVGGCFAVITYQYKDTFMPGLFINSIYAADMTVDELVEKLNTDEEIPDLIITERDGTSHTVPLKEIGYRADYRQPVQEQKRRQSVSKLLSWLVEMENYTDDIRVTPEYLYDSALFDAYMEQADYLKDNSDPAGKVVEVRYDRSHGYYLYDETTALLSHERAAAAIKDAIDNRNFSVNLDQEECYVSIEHTKDMQEALALWEDLSDYMETTVCYQIGDAKVAIDGGDISKLLAKDEQDDLLFDEDGKVYLDEKKVKEYIHTLAEQYNTVNKPREFKTTRGDTVTVDTGTYGMRIDEAAELSFLMDALDSGREQTRIPCYSQTNYTGIWGLHDIGSTYIEVDLTNQTMYYYVGGDKLLETPVVTGNTSLGRGTPQKVCYIYGKERNRTLRGEGYESFVNYWLPVYGGVGIHDASWRSSYGGKIYKTNGSHGCINTPKKIVSQLYDMVEIGTPVIIFY